MTGPLARRRFGTARFSGGRRGERRPGPGVVLCGPIRTTSRSSSTRIPTRTSSRRRSSPTRRPSTSATASSPTPRPSTARFRARTFRLKVGDTVIVHFENQLEARRPASTGTASSLRTRCDGTPLDPEPGRRRAASSSTSSPSPGRGSSGTTRTTTRRRTRSSRACTGSIIVKDPNEDALHRRRHAAAGVADAHARAQRHDGLQGAGLATTRRPTTPAPPHVGERRRRCRPSRGPTPVDAVRDGADRRGRQPAAAVRRRRHPEHPEARRRRGAQRGPDRAHQRRERRRPRRDARRRRERSRLGSTLDVQAGQGLRLQIVNAATMRFFRLLLTDSDGRRRSRSSGSAARAACSTTRVVEGGVVGGFDFKYDVRARSCSTPATAPDVVVAIPPDGDRRADAVDPGLRPHRRRASRTSRPCRSCTSTSPGPRRRRTRSAPARRCAPRSGDPVETLGAPTATLLDPATFAPAEARACRARTSSSPRPAASLGINDVLGDARLPRRLHGRAAPRLDALREARRHARADGRRTRPTRTIRSTCTASRSSRSTLTQAGDPDVHVALPASSATTSTCRRATRSPSGSGSTTAPLMDGVDARRRARPLGLPLPHLLPRRQRDDLRVRRRRRRTATSGPYVNADTTA